MEIEEKIKITRTIMEVTGTILGAFVMAITLYVNIQRQ